MKTPAQAGFCRDNNRRKGAMLIIALMFLTLLSLLGVTFAALMKLERTASRNFTDSQTASFVLHSGVDAVSAQLKGGMNYFHFTSARAPWLFRDPKETARLGAGRYKIEEVKEDQSSFFGILEPVQGIARCAYRCKVIDCASQINLNCGLDNLAMMLDNLGDAIANNPRIGFNPFYVGTHKVRGIDIVGYRRKLEGGRFQSKSQLAEILGEKNFDVLSDYVTVHSWVDPSTGKPSEISTELVLRKEQSGSVQPTYSTGETYQDMGHTQIYGTHSVASEPRSPININTATEEVLTAVFAGIGCRREFPFVERSAVQIGQPDREAGFVPEGSDMFPTAARGMGGGQEEMNYTVRPVWVYTPRITIQQARRMAYSIIAQRKMRSFVCWRAGKDNAGGFEDYVNSRFTENLFPRPQQVVVIDPLNPIRGTQYQSTIRSGGGGNVAIRQLWGGGHSTMERSLRKTKGLPFHTRNAWFYETVKAAIKVNANPNVRLRRNGVNAHAADVIDKTDLISVWVPDLKAATSQPKRSETYSGYTTEFCFDSGGYYEVTTLAELDEAYDIAQGLAKPKIYRKSRAVVKVFDVLRHTTQYDFAKQFNQGSFTSKRANRSGRENVMTFPHPLIATTDYMSSGSVQDGNIQLMGYLDAEKVRLRSMTRDNYYGSFQNVLFATGFMFRKSSDENQLITMIRDGYRFKGLSQQVSGDEQMLGGVDPITNYYETVLNAEYPDQPQLRQRYWPQTHGQNPLLQGGQGLLRVLQWPKLSESAPDFDNLRPDGLHNNLLNAPTRSNGIAMYPASRAMMQSGKGIAGKFQPAQKKGNVAYYMGGVAFWIRFDFDADDPVFSGLVGCTQVVSDVGETQESSEGNQFYIFKTSFGELRVVRIYYHRAYGQGSTELQPKMPEQDENAAPGGGEEDDVEADPNKGFARTETLVDISGWKRGEWHHVGVSWNDLDRSESRVQVFLDGQAARSQTGVTFGKIGEDDFCSLNTQQPYDELTIGGIIRRQAVAQAGLFKFAYNLTVGSGGSIGASATTGAGGVGAFVLPSLKVFPSNATIDEFVSYTGPYQGFRSSTLGRISGYYTRKGTYHNCFELTFPRGVQTLRIRAFDWTEYQPAMYHTPSGGAQPLRMSQETRARVYLSGTPVHFNKAPWLQQTSGVNNNRIAGKIFKRPTGRGMSQDSVKLVYRFDMTAANGQGQSAGLPLATPVIDDVTLSYFLPSPQLLSWEDLPVDYEALEGKRKIRRSRTRTADPGN